MSLPFISCICLSYGRVERLQEALACFLAQDYKGERELIILNSFDQQSFRGVFPNVRIVNLKQRPASLAACRNFAIQLSKGDVIVTFDDDDLYLPHYLTVVGEAYSESSADYVRLNPVMYSENWVVKKLFCTWINAVSFRKTAWQKVGGYARNLSVGEDQQMWSALSTAYKGAVVELKPAEIPLIYCWGNNTCHISGQGWDRPGKTPAYERAKQEVLQRVRAGKEPVGEIELVPTLKHDPVKMAKEFVARPTVTIKKNSVCLVELGRYGDIVNMLPIARHIAETYDTPHLMVSKEFASLLDGVSYVHPRVVDFRNDQLKQALRVAEVEFKHVINCQIWGSDWNQERLTTSFNRESWRVAGFNYKFDDHSPKWLPYFDKRDKEREAGVVAKILTMGKPLLLVNVTQSISSPFSEGQKLLDAIAKKFDQQYTLVNCGNLRLHRIYDILGLMEASSALVSIDTALLHLCAATGIPTVALVNDKAWQASECRGNCVARIPYGSASPEKVCELIELALSKPSKQVVQEPISAPPLRTIWHSVERHNDLNSKSLARKQEAWLSWDTLYRGGEVVPAHYWEPYERSASKTLGDPRDLPFLKDVLHYAMMQAADDDIIMFTNDDNILHPELPDIVRLHCSLHGCVCSQRCEFKQSVPKLTEPHSVFASRSEFHMGRDLFAFTKRYIIQKWDEIPDMVLGCSDWDLMMACMVRLQWGIQTTRPNLEKSMWPCELNRGYVIHRYHTPFWANRGYEDSAPGQLHNRQLFRNWAQKYLPSLKFYPKNTI